MHSRELLAAMAISFLALLNGTAARAQMQSDPSYPAPGHSYEASFSDRQFRLDFSPNGKDMTFTRADGSADTVQYTAVEIRPQVFMVYWHESASGNSVTHVEDFERGIVYTNIATKDGHFINLKGTLKKLS
jgi:hypothetical protein